MNDFFANLVDQIADRVVAKLDARSTGTLVVAPTCDDACVMPKHYPENNPFGE